MWSAIIALSVFLLVAVVAALWCLIQWRSRAGESLRLQALAERDADDLRQAREALDAARSEIESLQRARAEWETRHRLAVETARRQRSDFEEAMKQSREKFTAVAVDVLKASSEQFLTLARKSFESDRKDAVLQLEQRKQAVKALVDPIHEKLGQYDRHLQEIEKTRHQAYGKLNAQLGAMGDDQRRLREETANLVTALRRPEVRGRWGEIQLRRVAELAGMVEHCDFTQQVTVATQDGGERRPDMVVHLPAGRQIVVDSKAPMDAFLNAVDADDEEAREAYFVQHANQIEDQIRSLAAKGYGSQFERSPDFVVLFIPGESFLQPAVRRKPTLLERAMEKGIVVATPTTLVALLKAVEVGWREERIADNAKRISDLGRELHERLSVATGHLQKLGIALDRAVKGYNEFVGSFESRVMTSARRFTEMGSASSKALPDEIKPIDTVPRDVDSREDG